MSVLHRIAGEPETHRHESAAEARDCETAHRAGRLAPVGRVHSVPSTTARRSAAAGMARVHGRVLEVVSDEVGTVVSVSSEVGGAVR